MTIPVVSSPSSYYQNRYPISAKAELNKIRKTKTQNKKNGDSVEISKEAYDLYQNVFHPNWHKNHV